jgi:glycosyltransferase involved in cell wall biosynthesis
VPLRYGAGIKGKLGGAMAAGLPSVSTTLGVEGMALKAGNDGVFVTDDLQSFANYVVNLIVDESLWNRSSQASLQFAELNFGTKRLYDNVVEVFDNLGISLPEITDNVVIM